MRRPIRLEAAMRRPLVAAALIVLGASTVLAQAKTAPDTTKKNVPAVKTAAPQATKAAAPATQQKAATPPVSQSKVATPPAGQTKAAPPAVQTKAPAPGATKGAPAPAAPGAAAQKPNVIRDTVAALPRLMMREVFSYDGAGRRDPFLSLLTTADLRPTLSDLKLLMTVVDEPGRSVALLMDSHAKKQQSVRVGTKLGRMRVTSIRADAVIFTIEEFGMNRRDSLLLRDSTKVRGR